MPPIDRIRELAKEIGYAIGAHGSLERDLDLIAAPWSEEALKLNYLEVKYHRQSRWLEIVSASKAPIKP